MNRRRKRFIKIMSVLVFIALLAAAVTHNVSYFLDQIVLGIVLWQYWSYIQATERTWHEVQGKIQHAIELTERMEQKQS